MSRVTPYQIAVAARELAAEREMRRRALEERNNARAPQVGYWVEEQNYQCCVRQTAKAERRLWALLAAWDGKA